MNNSWRIVSLLVALLVAVPIGWVSDIQAQTGPPGAPGAGATMQQIEGKIKSVDPAGRMVTLEDGTKLMIPPALNVQRGALKEGAIVKASFEERGGQKVVTSLEVRAP
jgi:hypothetical protein